MNIKILHHNDLDGRAAGAIIRKKYPTAQCFEVNYDIALPLDQITKEDLVFIVDFTPPTEADFKNIVDSAQQVIWIDHHGRNIADHPFYNQALEGLRVEAEPSGAMCVWNYLFPNDDAPEAIMYVSDFDCWNFHYGISTRAFEAGMKTVDHQPYDKVWLDLLSDGAMTQTSCLNEMIAKGKVILDYRKNLCYDIVKDIAFECDFEGYRILACNMPKMGSLTFEKIDTTKYPIVSTFYSNGEKICVGLYSEDESVDCSEIAVKYGGGGHKGASGFSSNNLPFTNIQKISLGE